MAEGDRGPAGPPETLAERRKHTDEWRARDSAEAKRLYPVNVERDYYRGGSD